MERTTRGGRQVAARAAAAISAVFWGLLFFGVIDLAVPVEETPGFYESYLLETGWGVFYTFLVSAAFAFLVARPSMAMPAVQIAIAAVSLAVTALASGSWIQLLPAVVLAMNCSVVVALAREQVWSSAGWQRWRPDPVVGLLAVCLVPPAVLFAGDMVMGFRDGRPPLDDDTWGIDHWPTQGALALAVALTAVAVSAGVRARWSGVALSAGCVAGASGWFGFWSATYPDHAGSAGGAWGTALMAWAAAFVAVVGWRLALAARALPGR